MRRIIILLVTLLSVLPSVYAQKIDSLRNAAPPPRKESLRDMPGKTLKVVSAEDNSILDLLFKDAVEKGWFLSPFEFCSIEQFNKEKCDTNFYFLIRVKGTHRKEAEPAMEFLSLLKGSPDAQIDINQMPEILTLPLAPTGDKEGKVFSFLPAYITIIQNHVQMIIEKNKYAYLGMTMYTDDINHLAYDKILFTKEDFAFDVTEEQLEKDFQGKAHFVSQEEIDDIISDGEPGTLVPLVLSPTNVQKGAYCYNLLIDSGTQNLVYYKKRKLTKKGKGFLKADYLWISFSFHKTK